MSAFHSERKLRAAIHEHRHLVLKHPIIVFVDRAIAGHGLWPHLGMTGEKRCLCVSVKLLDCLPARPPLGFGGNLQFRLCLPPLKLGLALRVQTLDLRRAALVYFGLTLGCELPFPMQAGQLIVDSPLLGLDFRPLTLIGRCYE
jgi:hypothetical protein